MPFLNLFILVCLGSFHLALAKPSGVSENAPKVLFDGVSLENWAITDFAGHGDVGLDGNGSAVLEFGIALTGMHWIGDELPRVNYEIQWQAKKVMGTDFFGSLTFPYLKNYATLILGGWGGALVGISSIDGFDASENETATAHLFEQNQWYTCRLQVTESHFKFWVEQEKLIDVEVIDRDISMRSGEIEMSTPLGFSTYDTTGHIRGVRLYELLK